MEKKIKYGDWTYTVSQETLKNAEIDPGVASALGSYPLLALINTTGRVTQDWRSHEGSMKFRLDYFYDIEIDKYIKMKESFNTSQAEINKGDKVFMFGNLITPSINLSSILKGKEASRTRDINKANVIVIPELPKENWFDMRGNEEILTSDRTTIHKLSSDTVDLKQAFGIDNTLNPVIGLADHRSAWWSKQKGIMCNYSGDEDLSYTSSYSSPYENDSILVAAKYMETLYHTIKRGAKVITEQTLDKVYGDRTELDYDNCQTILSLLRSHNNDDVTMGATVLAESNYMHDGKPWAHYIYYKAGKRLSDINGNYKNIRSLKNTFEDTYVHPCNALSTFCKWYPDMDNKLKKLIIEESINDAMAALSKNGYGKDFQKDFNISIEYKHEQ